MLLSSLALCFASSGCGDGDGDRSCTLIGCSDGLTVELQPNIPSTYDVQLVLDGAEGAFTCTQREEGGWQVTNQSGETPVQGCTGRGIEIVDATPASVQIAVAAQDLDWTGSINAEPEYEALQPNGPECDPTCQRASLTIQAE
jgi:hypothetical protein